MVVEFEVIGLGAVNETVVVAGLHSQMLADIEADSASYLDVTTLVCAVISPEFGCLFFSLSRVAAKRCFNPGHIVRIQSETCCRAGKNEYPCIRCDFISIIEHQRNVQVMLIELIL